MPWRRVKMRWITVAPGMVLLLLVSAFKDADGIKCYVCGDANSYSSAHQQQNASSRLSCDEFDRSAGDALARFIVDCPKQYQGCITQKQGSEITRACDTVSFDDCQSANGITYCYCSGDLCNAPGAMNLSTTSAAYIDLNKVAELTDDEDYVDMSGDGQYEDFDPNEKTLVIKGNFDTDRAKTLLEATDDRDDFPPIPSHHGEVDNGNDFITTEEDYVHLVVVNDTKNATEPDATSTWSTVIVTNSTKVTSEIKGTVGDTTSTEEHTSTTSAASTVGTTHVGDTRKSSTRLQESSGNRRLHIGQLEKLIILLACLIASF